MVCTSITTDIRERVTVIILSRMGLFSSKKSLKPLFSGYVDYHCHILPGVDDGVQTFEDSTRILSLYSDMGVRKVYLTPHIMEDCPNTVDGLNSRFEELKKFLNSNNVTAPELRLASENMLDTLFEQRLEKKAFLTLPADRLLVETSYYNPPYNMRDLLFRTKSSGFVPVLAHPERYIYMELADYEELKRNDILMQLNLSSLVGFYGSEAKRKAEFLLKRGFYDFVGTDLHRWSMLESYRKAELSKDVWDKLSKLISRSSELF